MDILQKKLTEITKLKSGIECLTLTDFRNYDCLKLHVPISPIIITGENGTGKTNILEAISFLTPGRGLRSAKLSEIKRIDSEKSNISPYGWSINADIIKNNEKNHIGTAMQSIETTDDSNEYSHTTDRRIIKINQQKINQQSELGKYISAIWITPPMDRLFLGGPQPRRSFLDRLVYAFDLEHAKRTSLFEHLYRQWYQILKSSYKDINWLASLEMQMASYGVAIAAARRELIARLNTFIDTTPDDIFPDLHLELNGIIEQKLNTLSALQVEEFYIDLLKEQRNNIIQNETIEGVNRTDFQVFYKKKNMPAELCSTGEQKALLISIILAQTKCQILYKGFAPVLLLDEITTHLDNIKRDALLEKIKELQIQAWITSTEAQNFKVLQNEAEFFKIKNNKINVL